MQQHWVDFENSPQKPSLYLQGGFETGKTFFFKLIMQNFLKQQQDFLFLFMPQLPQQFKQNWVDNQSDYKMTQLKETKFLFLDNLGAENCTVHWRDDMLYPLLNYRHTNGLITFFSSNLNFSQLAQHLKLQDEPMQEIKALRIVKKIQKMCHFYRFERGTKEA